MLAAVKKGDGKKVAELIRQPGFNVNMVVDEDGYTLLHYICDWGNGRSFLIPLLLAHPDIDVNANSEVGETPFHLACSNGHFSCVRELLKDSRVNVNDVDCREHTPLLNAAANGHLEVIQLWIASGREMHLGIPGEWVTDAIRGAKERDETEVVTLLERFKSDPTKTRSEVTGA